MTDTDTLASLIEEHARLFTEYDSRDDEAVAFERIDEILPELRTRCEQLEPAPDDDALFDVLVGALQSEDTEVHNSAYVGLARLGHPDVIPLFLQRLNHGKSRYGLLITWAEEADAEMAKRLRTCLDRMPGDLEARCLAEVAVHLAETRNGAARDPVLLRRALSEVPKELRRWVTKMVETIRALDVPELPDDTPDVDVEIPMLARVTKGIADGWIRGVAWAPDGSRVYVGIQEPETASGLRTFNRDGEPLEHPRLDDRTVTDLALSSDGRWVAVAARKGLSAVVDTRSGDVVREVDEGLAATLLCVEFSPDDRHVAFCGNHVVVLSVDDWSVVESFSLPVDPVVKAARDWLTQTSTSRKGALKALASLDVTPKFRLFAERFARGSHDWKLLHDSLPDARPSALAWADPTTLLVGGQRVFERRLGQELRVLHTPKKTPAPKIWPDSEVLGLAIDARHVYVATRDALARYDHDFRDEHLFPEITFGWRILPSQGRVFVGGYGRSGLWCIEGDEATRIGGPINPGAVVVRSDGTVWCGERTVTGWNARLEPLEGPQHADTIVGIFEDADGQAVTCDEGGNIVRHGSGRMTSVRESGRCVSAGASEGAEWIALGIESGRAGDLMCFRNDTMMWSKPLKKGKPWCPMFRDEHVLFVADSKLRRCTLDGSDVRTKKVGKLGIWATPLGPELVVFREGHELVIVHLTNQKVVERRKFDEGLRDVAATPDGRRLCLAFEHDVIDVIDVATMQLRTVVRANSPGVLACTNEALYVTSRGHLLKHLFDASTVERVGELPLQRPWPSTIAVVGDEVWIGDHSGVLARALV